jgi:hypothetical protein
MTATIHSSGRLRRLRPDLLGQRLQSWLTGKPHATVGFSLLRIIFAVAMLSVLLPSFADRHYIWGAGSWWLEPEAELRGWWEPFRAVFSKEEPVLFDLAYFALIALVLVFLAGWKTRFVTPVLLLFWVGLSTNSTLVSNGGDILMRIVLLFAIFADLSRHLSVDAWLRRRRGDRPRRLDGVRARIPSWISPLFHNTALVLCCYQILLVYFVSSVLKLGGAEWLEGTALYYALVLNEFQVLPALSEAAWQVTPFVMLATWFAFAMQLVFPVMLLWRPTRYVAVVGITLTHLGIAVLLGLWSFSLAMIALDLLLIRDTSWAHALTAARRALRRLRHLAELSRVEPGPPVTLEREDRRTAA